MIATYNVVKILDAFKRVESGGRYVYKGINGKNKKAAIDSLGQYRKIADDALAGIIYAFSAKDVPITTAILQDSTFYGESIEEWAVFCNKVKTEVTTKVKDEENAKRKASKTDEPTVVEPRKDASKDQTKKAAPKSEYEVEIDGNSYTYTMGEIVDLLKNPETKFSVIFSICNKYKNGEDGDFNKACENTDYRNNYYKVSDIIDAYYSCMFETQLDSGAFLTSLNVLSNGYDPENKEKSLWEYEQMVAIQAISYSITLEDGRYIEYSEEDIEYSEEDIVTLDDMLDFISNEMDPASEWENKSLSSLKTKAADFVRNKL